jgi:serine/threonine-protein kinase
VIETSPPAGASVERGTTVTVRLSRGPEPAAVPDVTGETEENARSELEGAGLQVEVEREESEEAEPGVVLAQDPAGGTEVEPGTTVTVTVSEAPPPTEVPDVLGLAEADARGQLQAAGFTVRVREEETTTEAEDGLVIDQSPAGGETREEGTRVTVAIGAFTPEEPAPEEETPTPSPTVEP